MDKNNNPEQPEPQEPVSEQSQTPLTAANVPSEAAPPVSAKGGVSDPEEFKDAHRSRMTTYLVIAGAVLVALILGLLLYDTKEKTPAAVQKAEKLQTAFKQAGLPVPSTDQIVNTLGEDGGAMCEDPGAALKQAIRDGLAANGAAGPGSRPVFTDSELLAGESLAIQIYCPDQLPEYAKYVNEQSTADTVKE